MKMRHTDERNFRAPNVFIWSPRSISAEALFLAKKASATRLNVRKSVLNRDFVSKVLRNVPEQEGFHFYLAIGEPTGKIAVSLADFVEKMETIDVRSVIFHFPRKDFEKWIRDVVGDTELALRVGRIRMGNQSETLRNEILRVLKARLNELKPPPLTTSKPPALGGG